MKKRLITLMVAGVMVFSLAACSAQGNTGTDVSAEESSGNSAEAAELETITITSLNGNGEEIELEVPYKPEKVAILDMPSLDIIDSLGEGERVVGSADTSLDYLQDYVTSEEVAKLGTIKEADMEAVMECEPEVIFIGGRLASVYDDLSKIAPVVYLSTDIEKGVVQSVRENAETIASIFGKQEEVESLMEGFDARIEKLASFAADKTAIIGLCTSGGFNILGNDGRCSMIGNEIGVV